MATPISTAFKIIAVTLCKDDPIVLGLDGIHTIFGEHGAFMVRCHTSKLIAINDIRVVVFNDIRVALINGICQFLVPALPMPTTIIGALQLHTRLTLPTAAHFIIKAIAVFGVLANPMVRARACEVAIAV